MTSTQTYHSALAALVALTIAAGVTHAAADRTPIRTRSRRGGHYIVVLKPLVFTEDDPTNRRVAAASEANRLMAGEPYGAERVYANTILGFSAKMTSRTARRLANDPTVDYVITDAKVRVRQSVDAQGCTSQDTGLPWGLDRIDERPLPLDRTFRYSETGRNVHVYVIDTGIDPNHAEFQGRATIGWDATGGDGLDCNGHGTHVAATIAGEHYGVAKNAQIHGVRVLGCNGVGFVSDIIEGIDWVTGFHLSPAVANMSLGTNPGAAHQALDDAVRMSIASGVTYVLAAGNSRADAGTVSPARVAEAITVGASSDADAVASFSNFGPVLDLYAPGVNVLSAWIGSPTGYAIKSGTSMSAPHVTGAVAALLERAPTTTPADVATVIRNGATTNALNGVPIGTVNRLLFAPADCTPPTSTTTTTTSTTAPPPPPTTTTLPPPLPTGPCVVVCCKNPGGGGIVTIQGTTFEWCRNFYHPVCEGSTWGGWREKYWNGGWIEGRNCG